MAYSLVHDMMKVPGYGTSEYVCKRCSKRRVGRYLYEMQWYNAEGREVYGRGEHPECVWHDYIRDKESVLWW